MRMLGLVTLYRPQIASDLPGVRVLESVGFHG